MKTKQVLDEMRNTLFIPYLGNSPVTEAEMMTITTNDNNTDNNNI